MLHVTCSPHSHNKYKHVTGSSYLIKFKKNQYIISKLKYNFNKAYRPNAHLLDILMLL